MASYEESVTEELFSDYPIQRKHDVGVIGKPIHAALWTQHKSKLVGEYIRLFTFITKHGTYIDGFAAPQKRSDIEACSANVVLQNKPAWLKNFWLCDLDPEGCKILRELVDQDDKGRDIVILEGDFNKSVDVILGSGTIKEKTATFALLDQRGFECEWETVRKLAQHKSERKIEIFYFLATGWLDRSLAGFHSSDVPEAWWGRSDWADLKGMNGTLRANLLAKRFIDEFGYAHSVPFAIHKRQNGGRIMYHMIHASDHPEATKLMRRAYLAACGRGIITEADQFALSI